MDTSGTAAAPALITGVGAVTPLGVGAKTLHDRACAGELGIRKGVGECIDFDPSLFLTRKEIRTSDRFTQLALVAADEACRAAGWDAGLPYEPRRIGCVLATSIGGIQTCLQQQEVARQKGYKLISPLAVVMQMPNAAAALIAQRLGIHGECLSVVAACASGTVALGTGLRMLRDGTLDAVIVGGADAAVTPQAKAAFAIMGALSPSGTVRPFDRRRDGFVMGEGAGVLVLELPEGARTRGAPMIGEVLGFGSTNDAFHVSAPQPDGAMAAVAIDLALKSASLEPADIDYINTHGTASRHNDVAETNAIKRAFGKIAYDIPLSSTKSAIGHLMGAAGAVEAIATVLALQDGVVPPTLGLEEPDDGLDLDYVPGTSRQLAARREDGKRVGLSNSFGLGGHNAVVALASG